MPGLNAFDCTYISTYVNKYMLIRVGVAQFAAPSKQWSLFVVVQLKTFSPFINEIFKRIYVTVQVF